MSTADKLLTVAQNVEKVYNAGLEKGKSQGGGVSPANYSSVIQFINDDWAESEDVVLDFPNLNDIYYNFFSGVECKKIKTLTVKSQTPIKRAVNAFTGKVSPTGEKLEKLILYMDFSICTNFYNFCNTRLKLKYIEGTPIDFSSASSIGSLFKYSGNLQSFRVAEESIKVNIDLGANSLLDADTIQSVIDGLADMTGGDAKTLTLHADVKAKLTETQLATITGKNWTVA